MSKETKYPNESNIKDHLFGIQEYIIALQRAIEYHCQGKVIPPEILEKCPHHAKMLNEHRP